MAMNTQWQWTTLHNPIPGTFICVGISLGVGQCKHTINAAGRTRQEENYTNDCIYL